MGEKGNLPAGGGGSKNPLSSPAAKVPGGYPDQQVGKISDDGWAKDQAGYADHPPGKIATDAAAKWPPPPPASGPPPAPHATPWAERPPVPPVIGGIVRPRDDRYDHPPGEPPAPHPGS
jgi:hypothetical protein